MTGLLRPEEVADQLACPRHTVMDLHQAGELGGVRINARVIRFRQEDVDAFVERKRVVRLPRLIDQLPATGRRRRTG